MASLFCSVFAFVGSVPAIILGHKANALFRANPLYNGEKMARAGLMLGYAFLSLIMVGGGALALVQHHFTPIMTVRSSPALLPAASYRVVDEVVAGDQESEKTHGLMIRGTQDTKPFSLNGVEGAPHNADGVPATKPQRTAKGGGSFGYRMKVLPNESMSVNCRFWGNEIGGYSKFDIVVNDHIIGTELLFTNAPGHFIDMEFRIPRSLTQGQSDAVVEFQAHPKLRAGMVFVCQTLKP